MATDAARTAPGVGDQLLLIDINLKINEQATALKEMELVCNLIDRSMQSMVPMNTFFIVDMHSDILTGTFTALEMAPVS